MAFNTEPAIAQRDIQGASLDPLQKKKSLKDMLVKAKHLRLQETE